MVEEDEEEGEEAEDGEECLGPEARMPAATVGSREPREPMSAGEARQPRSLEAREVKAARARAAREAMPSPGTTTLGGGGYTAHATALMAASEASPHDTPSHGGSGGGSGCGGGGGGGGLTTYRSGGGGGGGGGGFTVELRDVHSALIEAHEMLRAGLITSEDYDAVKYITLNNLTAYAAEVHALRADATHAAHRATAAAEDMAAALTAAADLRRECQGMTARVAAAEEAAAASGMELLEYRRASAALAADCQRAVAAAEVGRCRLNR